MLGILTAQVLTGASCSKFVAWLLLFVIQLFCLLIWSIYTNLCSVSDDCLKKVYERV